jgi:hypothetical protein
MAVEQKTGAKPLTACSHRDRVFSDGLASNIMNASRRYS